LGKHAKLGPPGSPPRMVAGRVPRSSGSPPPCEGQRNVALARIRYDRPTARSEPTPRRSRHASLPRHTPASSHPPQSHRALRSIFATSSSRPKSAFLLTHFPCAESDVAPIPHRTPPAYHRNHPPTRSLAHGPFQSLVSSHPLSFEAFDVTAMTLPSFSSIELEALMIIASLLVVAASIVVILFSAIIGTGLARLLYLAARSCVKTILPNFVPVYQPIAVGHKGVKN
jgi:hypothetical protein